MKYSIEKRALTFVKRVIDAKQRINSDYFKSPVLCYLPKRPQECIKR